MTNVLVTIRKKLGVFFLFLLHTLYFLYIRVYILTLFSEGNKHPLRYDGGDGQCT